MYTKLNLINQSYEIKNSNIVLFSQNVNPLCKKPVKAWKVIEECDVGSNNTINFPVKNKISISDQYGNISEAIQDTYGDYYEVTNSHNGFRIRNTIKNSKEFCFRIENKLPHSPIDINIYKDDNVFKQLKKLKPNSCINVDVISKLYIGIASEIGANNEINPSNLHGYCTELSLKNIKSADIVLIGDGYGINTKSYNFILDNIVLN